MTTTPDDQDWRRIADEAFAELPEEELAPATEQPLWRYRLPAI